MSPEPPGGCPEPPGGSPGRTPLADEKIVISGEKSLGDISNERQEWVEVESGAPTHEYQEVQDGSKLLSSVQEGED